MTNWHSLTIKEVLEKLGTDPETGLSREEVKARQERFGKNQLLQEKPFSDVRIFLGQFQSPLVYILALAGAVNLVFGKMTDALVILAAVFLNAFLGFFQERKAAATLRELQKIIRQPAKVQREGVLQVVDAKDLVPGDIILLGPGDKVPADARVIECRDFGLDEAVLTGEWLPSKKRPEPLPKEISLPDRDNLIFAGTVVEEGEGRAVVMAIGQETEIGKIARLVKETREEKTPYQKKLARFSKIIGVVIILFSFAVFLQGVIAGKNFLEMFTLAVAVAVAAIPEGLPSAMTIVLAVGMQRILKRGGLVRKLVSAETLGSASIIVTDKTGTLTEAKMAVEEIYPADAKALSLKIALLCGRAFVENPQDSKDRWVIHGGATEKTLFLTASLFGLDKKELEEKEPRINDFPFDPLFKYSASLRQISLDRACLYVIGAPELILEKTDVFPIFPKSKTIEEKLEDSAAQGRRVLATAFRCFDLKDVQGKNIPELIFAASPSLTFAGLIVLQDPVRPEVKEAMESCRRARIRMVMATGDHRLTAVAVAEQIGLDINQENSLSGAELEKLSPPELEKMVDKIYLYYRVEPAQKLKIIEAWQKRGEVVAMTGDGVNDTPALKKADVGLALGSGTEAAKETADVVLLNNSFSVIVRTIEEGRAMIDSIRKVIVYLLSDSLTEIILVGTSILFKTPLPITAVQILWINLIEDGLPALALAFEPREKDLMEKKPEDQKNPLLTPEMKAIIFIIGLSTNLILLGTFFWLLKQNYELEYLRTMVFALLGMGSLFYVFSCKSLRKNLWQINPFDNKILIGAGFLSVIALMAAIHLRPLNLLLGTRPLLLSDWVLILTLGIVNVILIEAAKYVRVKRLKIEE